MQVNLEELKRLDAAATPGEWYNCAPEVDCDAGDDGRTVSWYTGETEETRDIYGGEGEEIGYCPAIQDARLIVALRNNAKALIAEIEELRADREQLLAALHLLEPADGWEGLENGDGVEIGTKIRAAIDAARFAEQPESATGLSKEDQE